MRDVVATLPTKSTGVTDEYGKVIWSEKYKRASEKEQKLVELKSMACALVLGQSSLGVISKLEGQEGYGKVFCHQAAK